MFLLNSCLGQFSAAFFRRHPFSRSYGVILPSSLTMLLPSAFGFSPLPPVSVSGTGTKKTIVAFLDSFSLFFVTFFHSASCAWILQWICQLTPYTFTPVFPFLAKRSLLCPHSSVFSWCRNLHLLSIDYAFLPRLRPRLTQSRSALLWKPWIFGQKDSHLLLATHSGILSSFPSTTPFGMASSEKQCSSTNKNFFLFRSFGAVF